MRFSFPAKYVSSISSQIFVPMQIRICGLPKLFSCQKWINIAPKVSSSQILPQIFVPRKNRFILSQICFRSKSCHRLPNLSSSGIGIIFQADTNSSQNKITTTAISPESNTLSFQKLYSIMSNFGRFCCKSCLRQMPEILNRFSFSYSVNYATSTGLFSFHNAF